MKFIACADLHFTNKCPKNRKDSEYFKTQIGKFQEILEYTLNETDSNILVVAGDFFDHHKTPYKVTREVLEMIQEYDIEILCIDGQHDLAYHRSGLDNTPLGILETAGVIKMLSNKYPVKTDAGGDVSFIGAGWNEEPENEANVLVMHRMITETKELFPGQETYEYTTAHQLMHKYKWADCVITGDNHKPHVLKKDGRLHINCGSMMRSTKAQVLHEPSMWVIDTNDWSYNKIILCHEPAKKVFDFVRIENESKIEKARAKAEEDIDGFIETLNMKDSEKPSFEPILKQVIAHANPKKNVKTIINSTMERIK